MSYYYDSDDDGEPCNLECVIQKAGAQPRVVHEYEGPVKITLVDLLDVGFWPRVFGSALLTLTTFFITCVGATIIFFSLTFSLPVSVNAHIAMCMTGFQLLIPNGILMVNPLFGPASQMMGSTRRWQHIFMQLSAFGFILLGSLHVLSSIDSIPLNPHTITGIMAALGACVAIIFGALYSIKNAAILRTAHTVAGMVTFIVSSVCTCMAIAKPSFKSWCKSGLIPEVPYILLILCVIYTALVMMSVKCRVHERNKMTANYVVFCHTSYIYSYRIALFLSCRCSYLSSPHRS